MSHPESPDVFYYNIIINNPGNTNNAILANYSEQRDIPLIKTPSDYYMSIIRFSVPGFSIPLLVVPVTDFPTIPPLTPYIISLDYNGLTVTINIPYYSRNSNTNNIANNPNSPYYFIYTYQHLIDLINNGFVLAMNTLRSLAFGALDNCPTPFLIFNTQTQLISFITEQYYNSVGPTYTEFFETPSANYNTATPTLPANKVNIFLNQQLFNFFQGVNFFYSTTISTVSLTTPFWLLVENTGNNYYTDPLQGSTGEPPLLPPIGLQQTQQYNSLNNWNSFNSLAFISKSLPILKEYTPNVGFQNQQGITQASSNTLPIITDFVPLLQFAGDQRSDYIYNANSLYRLIELQSANPLYSIDLQVVWIDQFNNQYPIELEPGASINIKFMFIKKSLYRGSNFIKSF